MTKGQRWSPRRITCIGTYLLLLCNVVAASNNEISTATSEATVERLAPSNATLLRKVLEDNGGPANARNDSLADGVLDAETRQESTTGQGTNSNREKVAATEPALDAEKQPASRSADDVNKPVTLGVTNPQADHASRKSRLTNNLDQNPGKSSSTKTGSEISPRPTRINDLTTASNKRGLELLLDDSLRNKSENTSSREGEEVLEEQCEQGRTDCEATTVRNVVQISLNDFVEIKKKRLEDFDVKESDEPDADDGDKEKVKDGNVSLINDTYVNYNHYYKTQHANPGTTDSANGTESNTIPKGVDVPDKSDPKGQVEIVGDVSSGNRLRIILKDNDTESLDSVEAKNHTGSQEILIDSKDKRDKEEEKSDSESSSLSSSESSLSESKESKDAGKLVPSDESVSSSVENITQSIESTKSYDGELISANESVGLQPKGRTVSFSKINDFSEVDSKITASARDTDVVNEKISQSVPVNKNLHSELTVEQRPYPYVKSNKNPMNDSTAKNLGESDEKKSTEEVASYENTIRQRQSEKKFVITEPSVVIENSIQQVKTNFIRKSANGTAGDASNQFESHVTTTPLPPTTGGNVDARNETKVPEVLGFADVEEKSIEEKTSDTENVVSLGTKEEPKVMNTGSFDVTGNAITEVSLKSTADIADKLESSYEISPSPLGVPNGAEVPAVLGTTLNPETVSKLISTKTDVQTDAEESMLIRSNFNVSEGSTEYPLTKSNGGNKTTAGPTTIVSEIEDATDASPFTVNDEPASDTFEITTHNSKDLVTESFGDSTEPKKSAVTSLGANSTIEPAMTSPPTTIEIEFVGLTENTVPANESTSVEWSSVTVPPEKNVSSTLEIAPQPTTEDLTTASETTTETNEVTLTTVYVTDAITSTTEDIASTNTDETTSTTDEVQPTTVESSFTESSGVTTASTVSEQTTSVDSMTTETETRRSTETDVVTSPVTQSETTVPSTERSVPMTRIDMANVTESTTVTGSATITKATDLLSTADTITTTTFVPSTVISPRITSSTLSGSSTTENVLTERNPEEPTDITPTLSPDEITSLVKIVIEGSWQDVCSRLIELRQSLADILSTGTDKEVLPKQIIFHQSPCPDSPSSTSVPSDDPLTSMLIYVVDEKGNFDEGLTKVLPSLYYKVSPINFPVTIHSFLLVQEADSRNAIAAVVISSVAFICLLLLAGLLFIMRKRQTRFNYGERCRPVSLDAYSLDSVPACNSIRRKGAARSSKRSYGNPTFEDSSVIPSHPLNFAGLSSFCGDVNAINEEFSSIPQVSGRIDELPLGAEVKNRYANVVPLPETRVPLQRLNNDPLTEYINASYVRGPKNATKYYIACQAPMESTVTDFWRMIWEQQCKVIIMLTDLVENGVEKCSEYVPPSEVTDCHRLYGDYQVTLKKRETKEKYAISTLHLKNLENNTFREVFHIWYLWPMNGVQSDGAGLIAVLLEARALQRGGPGPIVVHCSPGTGRTGTLIALDLGIRQYEITRTVDVPRVVYTIRRDRAGAVQTKEQYAFIYKALNLYATKLAGGVLEST